MQLPLTAHLPIHVLMEATDKQGRGSIFNMMIGDFAQDEMYGVPSAEVTISNVGDLTVATDAAYHLSHGGTVHGLVHTPTAHAACYSAWRYLQSVHAAG